MYDESVVAAYNDIIYMDNEKRANDLVEKGAIDPVKPIVFEGGKEDNEESNEFENVDFDEEYNAKELKELLEKHDIKFKSNESKADLVEKANKNLK